MNVISKKQYTPFNKNAYLFLSRQSNHRGRYAFPCLYFKRKDTGWVLRTKFIKIAFSLE